jgi:hypothetical protein
MQSHPHHKPPTPAQHHRVVPALADLLVTIWLAAVAPPVAAQARVSIPAPVASAAGAAQPGRHLMSPESLRDSGTAPGSLRPERPALPQVTVPMGVPPPEPTASAPGALPPNPAASAGGISDAVARCEAQTSALERRQCRRQLARQSPVMR